MVLYHWFLTNQKGEAFMLGEFIEASINFQNDTVYLMYLLMIIGVVGTAFVMFWSASRNENK